MTPIKIRKSLKERPSIKEVRSRGRNPIYIVLDNIRSLYNVGAIFRSSDAALVQKVFLTGITGKPPHKDIDKSALGATNVVPWEYCRDSRQVILELKSVPYTDLNYQFPLCLVVGNS